MCIAIALHFLISTLHLRYMCTTLSPSSQRSGIFISFALFTCSIPFAFAIAFKFTQRFRLRVPCIRIYLSFLMCILFTCTLRLHFDYIWNTSALGFLLHDVYTISAKQFQLHFMCSHTFTSTTAQLASFAISIGLVRIAVCALHFHSALRCMAHMHVCNIYIHVQSRTHRHTCTCTHTHTRIYPHKGCTYAYT